MHDDSYIIYHIYARIGRKWNESCLLCVCHKKCCVSKFLLIYIRISFALNEDSPAFD